MGRTTRHKEKHEKDDELRRYDSHEGTSARTRPLSFDEIMLKRNSKKLNENTESQKERNTEVGKVASIIQNDFNVDKSEGHRHGKDFSPGNKKCIQEESKKRYSHKKDENASWRKDSMSLQKNMENHDSRKRLKSEVRRDTDFVDEGNYDKKIHMKKKHEQPAGGSENADAKKHSRSLIEKDRHVGRSEEKYGRDIKRKHQTSYDEENRERNTTKKYDIQKGHASETVERKEKAASRSHFEDSHHKRRRSLSRERHRRSSSLPHKRASHHLSEQKLFSHDPRDKSKRQHSDERSKIISNGSSGHHRRRGGSTSGLGGYSPRKRKTEVAARTPSPVPRLTEKRTAKWDLAPAEAEKVVSASAPNLLASNQTVSLNMHAVVSSVPSISVGMKPLTAALTSSFLPRHNVSSDAVQLTEATRPMRRLYVENVPTSASEKAIMESFNNFLLSSGVNHNRGTQPCISCIIHKGRGQALVEFLTPEDASVALSFDGSPFSGSILKIRRPKDFVEVTGEPEKLEATVTTANDIVNESHHKIFVGGISKALSSEMFVEIAKAFGPLRTYHFEISKDLNEQYAILEYLDQFVTLKACAGLNGMKLGGQVITAVQADPDAPSVGNFGDHQSSIIPQLARPLLQKPTQVLKLRNLFPEDFSSVSEAEVEEVLEDVRLECSRFGTIKSLNVVKHENTIMTAEDNEMHDDSKETVARLESDEIKVETEIMELATDGNSGETAGTKLPSDTQEVAAGNGINDEKAVDKESCLSIKFESTIKSEDINHESLDSMPFQPRGLDSDNAVGSHLDTKMAVEDLALETVVSTFSLEVSSLMNTMKVKPDNHSDKNHNNIQSECINSDKILDTEEKSNVEDVNGKLSEGHPNTKDSVDDPDSKSVSIAISKEIPGRLNDQNKEPEVSSKIQNELINEEEKSVHKEALQAEEGDGRLPEVANDSAISVSMKSDTIEKNENRKEINLLHIFEPGCVFVEYRRTEASCMAAHCIHGRLFDDRVVTVEYIDPDLYRAKFPN